VAQLANTFEGGSNGTTITTGNSGGASGDAFNLVNIGAGAAVIYDNTHTAHGGLAMKCSSGTSGSLAYVEWDPSASSNFYGRFYIYIAANGAVGDWYYDGGSSGADKAIITTDASNHICLQDSTGLPVQATSTSTMALSTWHRIEFHIICSTTVGQMEAKLFLGANSDGLTPDETLTTAANLNTGASINNHLFGNIATGGHVSTNVWMDDILTGAAAYPGPAVTTPLWVPRRMPLGV